MNALSAVHPHISRGRWAQGDAQGYIRDLLGKHEPCVEEEKSLCTLAGLGFSFLPCKRSDAFP